MTTTVKTAMVTGANRGIGLEIVRQLATAGFTVYLGARDPDKGLRITASLTPISSRISPLTLDVSNSESIGRAAKEFGEREQRLDVLVNNAGVYLDDDDSILAVSRERLDVTFQTNTFGVIQTVQAFLPYLRKSDDGRIINISSGYGEMEGISADVPAYCLSKLALNGATRMLATALKPEGISVNAVCPGWVRTDMGGPNASRSPEEGADTAVWLAAEASSKLTGGFFRDRQVITW